MSSDTTNRNTNLEQQHQKEIELYIHIPFCIQKCLYCDFLSYPAGEEEKAKYIELLCKEITLRGVVLQNYTVTSIFFGGGTPTCLATESLEKVMDAIKQAFLVAPDAEISMEMNPGTVNWEKLLAYKRMGINRISIGLQSANNEELQCIGRIHTREAFEEAFLLARRAGFENLNVDLMSALPGQTEDSFRQTLQYVCDLQPEHISCYSLILEEGTPLYERQGEFIFPSEEMDRKMYADTYQYLHASGYERYEISNYAKPGKECRHNLGYWERVPYLGLGLGAASLVAEMRFKNPTNIIDYEEMVELEETQGVDFANAYMLEVEKLSKQDAMEEFMFLGLRKAKGIRIDQFYQLFHVTLEQVYGSVVETLIAQKVLVSENDYLRLTTYGLDVSNYVFSQFLFD